VHSSPADSEIDDADQGNPAVVSDMMLKFCHLSRSKVQTKKATSQRKKKVPNLLRNSAIHLV
jgi:hypothetical protein